MKFSVCHYSDQNSKTRQLRVRLNTIKLNMVQCNKMIKNIGKKGCHNLLEYFYQVISFFLYIFELIPFEHEQ